MLQLPTQNVDALAAALLRQAMGMKDTGFKHDASGSPAATGYMHGPNGLLHIPGVDPAVYQTVLGNFGILGQIPWTPSVYMNPLFETITGVTEGDTDERQEVCDDAPTAGVKKACIVQAPFGWVQRGTQEVDVTRLGQRLDRSDPMDLFIVGSAGVGDTALPGQMGMGIGNDQLINEWNNLLGNRAIAMGRKISELTFTGDPANNTNGYQEPVGLQLLVTTGHVDAITGTSCPSTDSLIMDFGYARADQNMGDLVTKMTYMARYVKDVALRTGMLPVRWAWVMRPSAFYEVTRSYACAYLFNAQNCGTIDEATQRLTLNVLDNVQMRDDMFNNRYLIIDGERWPVVLDDSIPQESNADTAQLANTCFASDIYLLPFSVLGGRSVLYGEYFQFQNPSAAGVIGSSMFLGRVEGAFLEVPRQKNNCYVLDLHIKHRIILRTPWLAGRINNVAYCPPLMNREPFPDDTYYVNGGVVGTRTGPSYVNSWD
jgi:hypothetical protein